MSSPCDARDPILSPDELRAMFMQREYGPKDVERLLMSYAALVRELAEHRDGTSPTAKMLDRYVKRGRVQTHALEVVRAELDLPEHIAEIVGDALAKDAGRV